MVRCVSYFTDRLARVVTIVGEIGAKSDPYQCDEGRVDHVRLHGSEDDLWQETLEAIASGKLTGSEAAALAKKALETCELEFNRHCAG